MQQSGDNRLAIGADSGEDPCDADEMANERPSLGAPLAGEAANGEPIRFAHGHHDIGWIAVLD
jgi:hypothetical protein